MGKTVLFAELLQRQDGRRVVEYFRRHKKLKIVNEYLCFLTGLHFPLAVITVGFLDFRRVSSSAEA